MNISLISAILSGGAIAAIVTLAIALLKRPDERRATVIAEKRLLLDTEKAERDETTARRNELKVELAEIKQECEEWEARAKQYRKERDEAILILTRRTFACERIGHPCEAFLSKSPLLPISEPTESEL